MGNYESDDGIVSKTKSKLSTLAIAIVAYVVITYTKAYAIIVSTLTVLGANVPDGILMQMAVYFLISWAIMEFLSYFSKVKHYHR